MALELPRLIPVVVLNDARDAAGLAEALVSGGLPVAEVTFRTAAAEESIRIMAERDDVLVGAGTVISTDQVERAAKAGARFLVSPGLSADVVKAAADHNLPIFPGVLTPSEIMAALDLGLTTLKFFPAGNFGGAKTLKAYASPFGQVEFIPTGGVSEHNLGDFLALPNVAAVGGSWMVPSAAVAEGAFDQIRDLCAHAVAAAAAFPRKK